MCNYQRWSNTSNTENFVSEMSYVLTFNRPNVKSKSMNLTDLDISTELSEMGMTGCDNFHIGYFVFRWM